MTTSLSGFRVVEQFPTLITPEDKHLNYADFLHLLRLHRDKLQDLMLHHGGLLFRGFPLQHAKHFAESVESLGLGQFINYIGGDSPRDKVENKVYTSTEAPPKLHIPLHQELSFMKKFPSHIYFFCEIASPVGGATIIGDARKILKAIDPDVKERFIKNDLLYTSHYYHQSKIMHWVNRLQRSHKSWTEVFETSDKIEVEKKCLSNEFEFKWLHHDWLQIQQTRPAMMQHPQTKETVWFNQAHLYDFNPKLLGWRKYLAAKLFYFRQSTRLHEIKFANGKRVPRADLYHILDVLDKNTENFPWQQGDIMVLDNILTMHGRAPFSGKRRVLTAMTIAGPSV